MKLQDQIAPFSLHFAHFFDVIFAAAIVKMLHVNQTTNCRPLVVPRSEDRIERKDEISARHPFGRSIEFLSWQKFETRTIESFVRGKQHELGRNFRP